MDVIQYTLYMMHTYMIHVTLGWPIAYSQEIKIVKVIQYTLAPVQSMPIIEIKFFATNL